MRSALIGAAVAACVLGGQMTRAEAAFVEDTVTKASFGIYQDNGYVSGAGVTFYLDQLRPYNNIASYDISIVSPDGTYEGSISGREALVSGDAFDGGVDFTTRDAGGSIEAFLSGNIGGGDGYLQACNGPQCLSLSGEGGFSFETQIFLITVPLPTAAPLFGAAVVALGAVGYGLNHRRRPQDARRA